MSQPPVVVGRYAIHGKIAAGGMATVHVGRMAGAAGFARTVAIKRLHPHLAGDEQFVLMFVDEARIAARIRHPNVVQTLDVVSSNDELLLVMEYVHGESLSKLMHDATAHGRGAPPRVAAALACGILHGLHAAHEACDESGAPLGIVHRDVSPQNVLLGADGVPRIVDFGVASAAGRMQSTQAGTLKGKMAYMAPERIRGDAADRRSDVYAVGVLLWEMLTGKRMFQGEDDTQVLARVVEGRSDPPSTHVPGLPRSYDAVVMHAIAREPADRYPTAEAMAGELEGCEGLASPSEVGGWVRAMAGDRLDARAQAIARIESHSGAMPAMAVTPAFPAEPPTVISDVRSAPSGREPITSSLRASALGGSIPPPASPSTRTIPLVPALTFAGGALIAGMGLAAVLVLHERSQPAAAGGPAVMALPSSAAVPPADPSTAAPPSAVTPSAVPVTDVDDLPLAPPLPEASASASYSHPRPLPTVAPAAPAMPKARNDCSPPYYYGADGLKHYKRECN